MVAPKLHLNAHHNPRSLASVGIFFFLLFLCHNYYHLNHIRREDVPNHESCVIYDRPPRTGSTTVCSALRRCLQGQGYLIPHLAPFARDDILILGLEQPTNHLAIVTVHFHLSHANIATLRRSCRRVYYITSTRTMRERLESRAKYQIAGGNGNVNRSVTEEQLRVAMGRAQRELPETEPMLENYPYFGGGDVTPDFVIRNERLREDLRALLDGFGCKSKIVSKNMHPPTSNVSTRKEEMPFDTERLKLKMDDKRHRKMTRLAETRNARGLRRATSFRLANV